MNISRSVEKLLSLIFAAALLSIPTLASAQGSLQGIVFGPEQFVRQKGEAITEIREFSISGFEGSYVLHLLNGDEDFAGSLLQRFRADRRC